MALSQQDRTLRIITIGSWVPAMALLIPYGVKTYSVFPALGLVPLTMSAILGFAKIYGVIKDDYRVHAVTIYSASVDAFIAVLLLLFMIPGIIRMRWPELGTFAVFPLLVNICIHTFFVLRETAVLTRAEDFFKPRTCQYCQRDLKAMWDMKKENAANVDSTIGMPAQQSAAASAPLATMPDSAPPRYSTSTSALTTPRPSVDFDNETLDGREGSIRSSQSTIKFHDASDVV